MNALWLVCLIPSLLAPPQDAKPPEGKPASTNIRGSEYPRILDDLRVTFRIKAPGRPEGRVRVLRQHAVRGEEGRGRLLDRDDDRSRRARLPLLPDVDRRRAGERPGEPDLFRDRPGHERDRGPREGRRLLHAEGRPARARSASAGTSRRRPRTGVASSSTRRPATTLIARRATPSSTSSTAAARTRPTGPARAA